MFLPKSLIGVLLIFSIFVFSCTPENSCSCSDGTECLEGNGNVITTEFDLGPFESIIQRGILDIEYYSNSVHKVELITDSNLIDSYVLNVNNNLLSIWSQDICVNQSTSSKVRIGSPELNYIDADGTGDINFESLESKDDELFIRTVGTGEVVFAGDISLSSIFIGNVGTGNVKAFNVSADTCIVNLLGTGDIEITVSDELIVSRDGIGTVFYKGFPDIEILSNSGIGGIIDAN